MLSRRNLLFTFFLDCLVCSFEDSPSKAETLNRRNRFNTRFMIKKMSLTKEDFSKADLPNLLINIWSYRVDKKKKRSNIRKIFTMEH